MGVTVVSYSKIKRWRFCRMSYYFNYVEKIVPKKKPRPLKLGSIVHAMLEAVAKEKDWTQILDGVTKEYSKMMEEEKEFYGNLPDDSSRIIKGYQKMWSSEKVSFQLIEKELGPIPLTPYTAFTFRADRLMRDKVAQLTFLCETKTGRKIPQEEVRVWDLQTVLYIWALRQLGYKVDGVLWDYIRTKPPTIPQVLKNGQLSQRADMDTDYATYFKAVKDNHLDLTTYQDFLDGLKGREHSFYRRVRIPITEGMIEPILNDAKITSKEIHFLADYPVKSVSGFTCPRCFYQSLCYAQLRQLDEDFIRKAEFMPKEEEVDYGIEDSEDN